MNKRVILLSTVLALSISFQASAAKPFSVVCGDGETIKVGNTVHDDATVASLCLQAGHPAPKKGPSSSRPSTTNQFSTQGKGNEVGLLLPAVQAAREAARSQRPKK